MFTEQDLRDALREGAARMTERGVTKRRDRSALGVVLAAGVAAGIVVGVVGLGALNTGSQQVQPPPLVGPSSETPPVPRLGPGLPARPPRPARVTLDDLTGRSSDDSFRPYSGPLPPPFSADEVLARIERIRSRAAYPELYDAYIVGRVDFGSAHVDGSVDSRTPAWVVAGAYYLDDLNDLSLGGPIRGPEATPTPQPPRPGWARFIDIVDARTGAFLRGSVY